MKGDIDIGPVCIRMFVPWMARLDKGFRRKLRSCIRHLRPSYNYSGYGIWFRRYPKGNNRCYCPTGYSFHGYVKFAGFGFALWASKYLGPIPCPCDDAMHEMYHDKTSALYDPEACDDPDCKLAAA